jgi:NB-ARC domain/Tetratricopeptide repeat
MIPFDRNPYFLGRDGLLRRLRNKLEETKPKRYNHRVAIYGMGGVGKTQVAIEYVYRHQNDYDDIYWISASDQATLLSGFQEIGMRADCLFTETDPLTIAKNVLSWLRTKQNWLLVMDNLDDISVADGFLPATDGGHTLITTRNPDAKRIPAEGFEIPIFGRDDAVELLRVRSEIVEDEMHSFNVVAADIVHELGYHALAIEHAAAFVRSTNLEIAKFLQVYQKSRKHVLSRESTSKQIYPNSIAATFLLSFEKVRQNQIYGQQASMLLQFFAFLNPDEILIDFLQVGSSGLRQALRETIENSIVFHESLGLLQQFSLVGRSHRKGSIVVHRLIQAVLKDELKEQEMHQCWEDVLDMCDTALPGELQTHEGRMRWRSFQSQIIEPALEATNIQSQRAGVLIRIIASFLRQDGKFKDSERMNKRSYEILRKFGEEDPDTLATMGSLALTYWGQGKYQEAADLDERRLEVTRRTMGDEHPSTLLSMNNLAMTYWQLDKLGAAVELMERCLERRSRLLGEEHPDTLLSMGNLAKLYLDQGKLEHAADLAKRTLDGRRSTLGEDHRGTLTSMGSLATAYWTQGKFQEASILEENELEMSQRTLGQEHPDTLTTMSNLARTYEDLGKLREALSLIQKSYDGSLKTLGVGHPYTTNRKITLDRLRGKVRVEDAKAMI